MRLVVVVVLLVVAVLLQVVAAVQKILSYYISASPALDKRFKSTLLLFLQKCWWRYGCG